MLCSGGARQAQYLTRAGRKLLSGGCVGPVLQGHGLWVLWDVSPRLSLLGCKVKLDLLAASFSVWMTWDVVWELE